jgi:hypothetical protein
MEGGEEAGGGGAGLKRSSSIGSIRVNNEGGENGEITHVSACSRCDVM